MIAHQLFSNRTASRVEAVRAQIFPRVGPCIPSAYLSVADSIRCLILCHLLRCSSLCADWSLQRTAAVFIEGTEGVAIERCRFKYLGGIAYQVSGYNRNASVTDSEFAYLGGSAMTSWGYTSSNDPQVPAGVGIDGTNGNQPHGTRIERNVCRELGIEEKQSSCWFQAKTQQSFISANLFWNGPRYAFLPFWPGHPWRCMMIKIKHLRTAE